MPRFKVARVARGMSPRACAPDVAPQRGAAMVEAAIVLPLLFSLIFGIFEIGGVVKSYSSAANSVRAGGRMASVAGSDALADQAILERMALEAGGLDSGAIDFIVIWHASGPGDDVPPGCVAAAGAASTANTSSVGVSDGGTDNLDACNVYVRPQANGAAFDMALGSASNPLPSFYFGCSGSADPNAANKLDCNWPPQHRRTVISPRVLPAGTPESARLRPDYVGVYMRLTHTYVTGILGSTRTITDSTINLLEPDVFGLGGP